MYDNIDMKRTGALLKRMIEKSGYTVKDIQKITFVLPSTCLPLVQGDNPAICRSSLCPEQTA